MLQHDYVKRTDPGPFRSIWRGQKRAELRKEDDCRYEVGDRVLLLEYDRNTGSQPHPFRNILIEITHVIRDSQYGLERNWVMASFKMLRRKVNR